MMALDRKIKVNKENHRLLSVKFIKPIIYAEWVSNIIVVLKKIE